MALEEGKLHFSLSLVFMSMCEITRIRKGKKNDLSLIGMSIIRDSILEKIQVGDIVRRNGISYGTATECVINLEKKGYLDRIKSEEDGRVVYVTPTVKALRWFDDMEMRTHAYIVDGFSRLSREEQKTLIDLLARFAGYGDESLREESFSIARKAGDRAPQSSTKQGKVQR
jgi:DNA-binding MarR family transcriptional regulator